jgi:hypothetical protein
MVAAVDPPCSCTASTEAEVMEAATFAGRDDRHGTLVNRALSADSRKQFMKIAERNLFASVLAITSFLAACGGGGGDSGSELPIPTAPTLAITTGNHDLVSMTRLQD